MSYLERLFQDCYERCKETNGSTLDYLITNFNSIVKHCSQQQADRLVIQNCINDWLQAHPLPNSCLHTCTQEALDEDQYDLSVNEPRPQKTEGMTSQDYQKKVKNWRNRVSLQRQIQTLTDKEADKQLGLWVTLIEAIQEKEGYSPTHHGLYTDIQKLFENYYPDWLASGTCQEIAINNIATEDGLTEIPTHDNFYEAKIRQTTAYQQLGHTQWVKNLWRTMKTRLATNYANDFLNVPATTELSFSEEAWDPEYDVRNPITDERLYKREKEYLDEHEDGTENWQWNYEWDYGNESDGLVIASYDDSSYDYISTNNLATITDFLSMNSVDLEKRIVELPSIIVIDLPREHTDNYTPWIAYAKNEDYDQVLRELVFELIIRTSDSLLKLDSEIGQKFDSLFYDDFRANFTTTDETNPDEWINKLTAVIESLKTEYDLG